MAAILGRDSNSEHSADGSANVTLKEPVEATAYVTEPTYVLELLDYNGDVVKREESATPYKRDKVYKSGKNPHVLEVVRSISSSLRTYSPERERILAFETAPISSATLHILSPLLLRAMHDVITYYPDRNPYSPIKLPYPFSLLVHHTRELEVYKTTNVSALSPEDVEERNRHIDCALKLIDVEHGEAIIAGKAGQEQDPPVTTFKNYWMLLKPGALVYKTQHGVISTYVVHGVTGGVEDEKVRPYVSLWIHDELFLLAPVSHVVVF